MDEPQLIFVTGCNAAGKSTFIRTRLSELHEFTVLMTDVYKSRTKDLAKEAIGHKKNMIIETVFNDSSFTEIVDTARHAGYFTSLIVLVLDSLDQSIRRVAFRGIQQNGITISGSNVKLNFNESFKNAAYYFFYFDRSDFIYTGIDGQNNLIMQFQKSELVYYRSNDLLYTQKFAAFSHQQQRLKDDAHSVITANVDFERAQ